MELLKSKKGLIDKIMKKRELSGIDRNLVKDITEEHINKLDVSLSMLKKSEQKTLMKEVRSELRKYAGRFQKSIKKRMELLEKNNIDELLKTHSSTNERIDFYPKLKRIISKLGIKSILDIGCGINPIALANDKMKYYASDINIDELDLVKKYFKKEKISGETFVFDLRKIRKEEIPIKKADLCIIFKVLDIVGRGMDNLAESIISSIDCKYFLISFSTRTLSGKPMNRPKRLWMEDLLLKQGLNFKIFETKNEIFYLAYPKNNLAPVEIR